MIRRASIVAAVAARLSEIAGVTVELMPAGEPDRFPALQIYDSGHVATETSALATRYLLAIDIDGYVTRSGGAASGAAAHDAANDLYAATVAALMRDPSLGGLAVVIDEKGFTLDVIELAELRAVKFTLSIEVEFVGNTNNPAAS